MNEDLLTLQQEEGTDNQQLRINAVSDEGSQAQPEVGLNYSSPTNCNCGTNWQNKLQDRSHSQQGANTTTSTAHHSINDNDGNHREPKLDYRMRIISS